MAGGAITSVISTIAGVAFKPHIEIQANAKSKQQFDVARGRCQDAILHCILLPEVERRKCTDAAWKAWQRDLQTARP